MPYWSECKIIKYGQLSYLQTLSFAYFYFLPLAVAPLLGGPPQRLPAFLSLMFPMTSL